MRITDLQTPLKYWLNVRNLCAVNLLLLFHSVAVNELQPDQIVCIQKEPIQLSCWLVRNERDLMKMILNALYWG